MKITIPFFKKRTVSRPLSSAEQVEAARNRVSTALSVFTVVHEELDVAITELEEAISQDDAAIMRLETNRQKAGDELRMSKALKNKVSEFVR